MKLRLTENGVYSLYNISNPSHVKLQVLYLAHWNMAWFTRLADSECLSPILILLKMTEPFSVGDILLIKKVQVQSLNSLKTDDLSPMADMDLCHLIILEYQVVDSNSKFSLLYQQPEPNPQTAYWNSLKFVKHLLIKADSMAESFFKEEEKRLHFLRNDCNLLRERGNELYKKKDYNKAILHYNLAKQKDRYDSRVWNNSSQSYFVINEYENARRDAFVALKLDPFCVKAYFRAGKALEKLEDIKSAVEIIEAGLYICGDCDNLQALLHEIKAEGGVEMCAPKCNGDTIAQLSDVLASKKSKHKNSPIKKPKEEKTELSLKTNRKHAQVGPILSFLEGARMLYETGKFQNALEIYGDISSKYNCSDYLSVTELQVLRYLICICKFKSGKGKMEDNINAIKELSTNNSFPFPPAIHYWLSKIYEILAQEEKVIHHGSTCGTLLSQLASSYNLTWPGTNDPIPETSPDELKAWFNEGSWRPAPLARCRYTDCISTQAHSMARREIYPKDFDFRGYVEVNCEELCFICYHPCCWKALKEQKEEFHGKRAFKDLLGHNCFTPDCTGKIWIIRIFDENSQMRNELFRDKKEKKNATTTKSKKKKDKKKESNNGTSSQNHNKSDDKKKKIVEAEIEEPTSEPTPPPPEVIAEPPPPKKNQQAATEQPAQPINYHDTDFMVLKPNEEEDLLAQNAKKSKSKNKKKKAKNVAHLSLNTAEYLEDRSSHNTYLSRLRDLKLLRESQESDAPFSTDPNVNLRYLPESVLDPERPFYLPQHLQQNHKLLESVLQSKMVTVSSSDIETESINTLLEFMYDWLKEHNPMSITDSRLSECISDSFPVNAVTYVNKCGGIKSFLLQSFKFAVIDDLICVKDQVIAAQEQVIKNCLDKFRSSKYLLSDGYKAQKLSHLLDDSKSTSSSTSSYSTNPLISNNASVPLAQPNQTHTSSDAAKVLKSYTEVAMGKVPQKKDNETQSKLYVLPKPSPKQQTVAASKPLESTPRKRKLKTMDIDAIEVLGAGEMSQLFSPGKPAKFNAIADPQKNIFTDSFLSEKLSKLGLSNIPSSKDQSGSSLPSPVNQHSNEQSALAKMTERIKELEKEVAQKTTEIQKFKEGQETLSNHNQELNDRYSQIKTKSTVEITGLKKQLDEAQEQAKAAESSLEWFKNQREGDIRKLSTERARLQEELKVYITKNDGLQLCVDQFNSAKTQMEEEIQQKSIQLANQQDQVLALQESLKNTTERARDAEFKYLSMKKELIKSNLEKTKKRLTAEVNKMYEVLQEASERSRPKRDIILRTISDWEETIHKIQNAMQAVVDDGQRFIEYIRSGRPLSALPPGDLQIPSIPDLTVAHLLFISKDSTLPLFPIEKPPIHGGNIPMSSLSSYLNSSTSKNSTIHSNSFSNFAPSSNISPQIGGLSSGGVSFSPGQLPIGANSSLIKESKPFNITNGGNSTLTPKPFSVLSADVNPSNSAGTSPSPSGVGVDFGGFRSGSLLTETAELLVGHLPWSFSEDQLKKLFAKFGDVLEATIFPSDKKSSKFKSGSVVFLTKRQRDLALRSVPLVCGNHTLSLHAKEAKGLISKPSGTEPTAAISDLTTRSTPVTTSLAPLSPLTSISPLKQTNSAIAPPTSSAYGLQGLVDVSNRAPARTISTPTTPTATKPKLMNVRSASGNVGAIGTLPPKLIRPIPRSATAAINVTGVDSRSLQGLPKQDDSLNNSGPYKRLIDECKARFGNDFSVPEIHKSIREVREANKNSLSGMVLDAIMDQIHIQLRSNTGGGKATSISKPSIAPWAQLTQGVNPTADWGGPLRPKDISDDHCAICLELLGAMTSMPLPCHHTFHVACIKNWLNKKSDCPICRKFALNSDEFPSLSHNK